MNPVPILRNERGVALPMALIVLVALTTLMLAFAVLVQTEPVVAHNQLRGAQARTHAEAGFERAVWALSQGVINPGTVDSLPEVLPVPTPAPYDGSVFVANGNTGGYLVNVTTPDPVISPNQRQITSTGWTPTNSVADTRTKAHRRIQATVERFPPFAFNTPCALCVKGDLGVGGNALVDATTDTQLRQQEGFDHRGGHGHQWQRVNQGGGRERDRQPAWHRLSTESDRSEPLQRHHARRGQFQDAARAREEERHLFRPRVSERDRGRQPHVHGQRAVQFVQQGEERDRLRRHRQWHGHSHHSRVPRIRRTSPRSASTATPSRAAPSPAGSS